MQLRLHTSKESYQRWLSWRFQAKSRTIGGGQFGSYADNGGRRPFYGSGRGGNFVLFKPKPIYGFKSILFCFLP